MTRNQLPLYNNKISTACFHVRLFPFSTNLSVELGLLYMKQREYDKAFNVLGNTLCQDPENPKALLTLAAEMQVITLFVVFRIKWFSIIVWNAFLIDREIADTTKRYLSTQKRLPIYLSVLKRGTILACVFSVNRNTWRWAIKMLINMFYTFFFIIYHQQLRNFLKRYIYTLLSRLCNVERSRVKKTGHLITLKNVLRIKYTAFKIQYISILYIPFCSLVLDFYLWTSVVSVKLYCQAVAWPFHYNLATVNKCSEQLCSCNYLNR